jgi:ferric-dicitrate binding protein FerR (iron transport regulator)
MAGPDQSKAEQEQAARDWWHVMADDASAAENFAAFAQWCDAAPGNRETFDRISLAYQQSRTA